MENIDLNFNAFLKKKAEEKANQPKSDLVPEVVTISFQKFFETIVPEVVADPLIQMKLINLIKGSIETAYLMGVGDGQRSAVDKIKEIDNVLGGLEIILTEIIKQDDNKST